MFTVFKVFLFDVRIYDLQTNFVMFVPEIRIIVIVIVKNKSMLSATFVNNYLKIYGLIQTTQLTPQKFKWFRIWTFRSSNPS
jgi:isochorismate hydrolase